MGHFGDELREERGHIYVGLPLKESTNLPVHIHGNFELDHGRNGLLPESSWNKIVLRGAICMAYLQLLDHVRLSLQADQKQRKESWIRYFFLLQTIN